MNRRGTCVAVRGSSLPLEPGSVSSCYRTLLPVSVDGLEETMKPRVETREGI